MSTTTSANEAPPDHVINFGCGHPDATLLPVQHIADATQRLFLQGNKGRDWLQYGRENGNYQARQVLAEFLTNLYQDNTNDEVVNPENLCFTSGVSHGVQLTCRTLQRMHLATSPTQEPPLCFVENPTYFLIPPIFQQSGYELEAVETNKGSGLYIEAFEKKIKVAREASPSRLLVLYSIPVHHNPLGVSLNEEDRTKLVELCDRHEVYLIADEVYHGLTFPNAPKLTPMAMLKSSSFVISTSAFTKILCPGIRCGWIQTSNIDLLRRIGQDGVLDSGGCSSQLSSGIVVQLVQSGALPSYMASAQSEFSKRCHHLCQTLKEASTAKYHFEFEVPQGGYFLWVKVLGIEFAVDGSFQSYCRTEHHVDFKTGASCSPRTSKQQDELPNPQQFANCMRLCFAYYDTESLAAGVKRLCQAIEEYPNRTQSSAL